MRRLLVACAAALAIGIIACIDAPRLAPLVDVDASAIEDAASTEAASQPTDDAAPPDDPAAAACAAACPLTGGACEGGTCTVRCPGPGCKDGVTCPTGVPCLVVCTGKQVCGAVDCAGATECTVRCIGEQACKSVRSETANARFECNGKQACKDSIFCSGATCAIDCAAGGCELDKLHCCATTTCTVNGFPAQCR